MAITEDQRHDLYEGLIEVLGREKATTLMEHLPPVGWADVATKRDLDHQSAVSRRDLEVETAKLSNEMQAGFSRFEQQILELRQELRLGLAEVRGTGQQDTAATRAEVAAVRVEVAGVETGFERALREQTRLYLLGMITANAALAGLAFTFARVLGA